MPTPPTAPLNEEDVPSAAELPRRVLLVDDHPLFREGLAAAIDADDAFTVVAEAATADQALAEARRTRPHVVVMDLGLPGLSGIEATRALLSDRPGLRILVMTMSEDTDSLLAAVRAGAHGYILKGAPRQETLRALHTVAEGGAVFSPGMTRSITTLLTARHTGSARQAFPALTTREREILDLLARGLTYRQIARRLVIADKTIRNHAGSIFAKLQVHDRAEAILRAREAGLGHD
ncbi:response regulator [Actinocorallia populi]|uniref:response regulator n=1 Tax=Actinocorallia populi TaxID=2079200 RepID=UPI000D0937A9|nr:response regulator transcription factor [Actinocorallia populi]